MHQDRLSRPASGQRFLPFALIGVGLLFLIGNLVPGLSAARGGLVLGGLGLVFLIGRVTTARYGYAVPAGLLLGLGSFVALQEARSAQSGGWFFILLGLGFCLVYVIGWRPGAVWPLVPAVVLIGLGLLFFAWTAVLPLASLAWIASYWPVVLVLIGGWLVLHDRLPAASRRPVATLGTVLVLGYALVAAAASVAAGGALARGGLADGALARGGLAGGTSSASFSDSLTLDAPITPGDTLSVNNPAGRTAIRARVGEGSGVHAVAVRHFSGGAAPDVQLVPGGGGLSLQQVGGAARPPFFFFGPSAWVDYDVEVPATVRLNLQAGSGDVDVEGLSGAVTIDSGSGSLTLANLAGAVDARAGSGNVSLTNATGEVRLQSGSGAIRGTSLQHLREASAGSGSIVLTGTFSDATEIRTGSGNIELHLLAGSSVRVDARTQSGRLSVRDLPLTQTDRSASGSLGGGGENAILRVESGSGSINLSS